MPSQLLLLLPQSLPQTHATALLQYLMLIVHDDDSSSNNNSYLQQEYLHAVKQSFYNLSQSHGVVSAEGGVTLQWMNVAKLDDMEFEEQMLHAVDAIVTEGFITILKNTERFLHARYYATRNAELRLKDKFYLFLCEHENPKDFLAAEILQFYPHHLMVIPELKAPNNRDADSIAVTPEPRETTQITTTSTLNKFSAAAATCSIYHEDATPRSNTTPPLKPTCHYYRDINFQMWTQKFVGDVGNLDAMLLDSFLPNETFANKNVELYPNKVFNLKGRTLRAGSITYIPYVVTNYVPAGTGNVDPINSNSPNRTILYLGSEADIVKTFCEVRNCHLRVEAYGVDNWGMIYENESSSGMLGDIYTQNVELAIGCIYNWYHNLTETSHTIARSAVTVLGPAPAQFPAWRTNIMPFTDELWLFLITTMLLCSVVLYSIKYTAYTLKCLKRNTKHNFRHVAAFEQAILDIFAVFIQQPSAPTGLNTFAARFFLTTILCATITLENTYSGQLKSILTIPFYGDPVDTIDKWSQTNWKWGAPSIVWVQTVENSDLLKEQIMTKKFEVRDYDYLYNATFHSDYGFGVERLMSGSFTFGDYITAPVLEMKIVPKDDLYFDWTRAVSIRGWPLMPLFNRHVRSCMETGLFVHWERQIVAKYLDRQTQEIMLTLASGHTNKMPPKKLTVQNISGATFALLFGYLIAVIILFAELFIHTMRLKYLNAK